MNRVEIGKKLDINHVKLLDHLIEAVDNKWDGVILVDGVEGSGKSNIAFSSAYYLDQTFSNNRIVFRTTEFIDAVEKAKPGQAIVWDEFITGGLSGEFMTEAQRTLTKYMTMIRKKNLYIIWVMPYFFIVGKYFAVARSRFLLHSSTPDGIKRGYWRAWNYDRKRTMYFRGKREMDYCIDPYLKGRFGSFFELFPGVVDEDAYEKAKDDASKAEDEEKDKMKSAFINLVKEIRRNNFLTPKEISDCTGYSRNWIYQMSNEVVGEYDGRKSI